LFTGGEEKAGVIQVFSVKAIVSQTSPRRQLRPPDQKRRCASLPSRYRGQRLGIVDIYAIARDAFRGGRREIQLQSYPFRMTAETWPQYRLDPNIDFWMEIKNGSDHFEVTKTEPSVIVCNNHYVFGATADEAVSATGRCPTLHRDNDVEAAVVEKESKDEAKVTEPVASGVKPIRTIYADGGQNPVFQSRRSRLGSAGYRG
jgi:hypothetical protein